MNLGTFGKLSIVYAVLALFLIIELGLTGYGKCRRPSRHLAALLLLLLRQTKKNDG